MRLDIYIGINLEAPTLIGTPNYLISAQQLVSSVLAFCMRYDLMTIKMIQEEMLFCCMVSCLPRFLLLVPRVSATGVCPYMVYFMTTLYFSLKEGENIC